MKFYSKFIYFHSRKCIWNCPRDIGGLLSRPQCVRSNFTEACFKGPNLQLIACHLFDPKPLPETMPTQFNDAYMRHHDEIFASLGLIIYDSSISTWYKMWLTALKFNTEFILSIMVKWWTKNSYQSIVSFLNALKNSTPESYVVLLSTIFHTSMSNGVSMRSRGIHLRIISQEM